MVVVGTEKKLTHIEISDLQVADIIKRSSDGAFKCGVQERIEQVLINQFNQENKDKGIEPATYITEDGVGTLCYATEIQHYHGRSQTKFLSILPKKELDILENMNKMLSVFD